MTSLTVKGIKEGKEYEKLVFVLLAKRAYEVFKVNPQIHYFALGRQVSIGEDRKLDDIVLRFDNHDRKNLIFVQVKHKLKDSLKINSQILSGSSHGQWGEDFNLRHYFTSYLSIRDELQTTESIELQNGKVNYVAILTNVGLDNKELEEKGFKLKEAPDDIKNLFKLKKSSETKEFNCCQLGDDNFFNDDSVSDHFRSFFGKCSDLHRIAEEFVHAVISDEHKEYIMRSDKAPMKYYHVALEREVIKKSSTSENLPEKQKLNDQPYCIAKFKNDFIFSKKKTKVKNALLDAIIRAVKEKLGRVTSDDIKKHLCKTQWKIIPNFGQNEKSEKFFPEKWNPSELCKLSAEFAKCVTSKTGKESEIFGNEETLKQYEVAFCKIIEITPVACFRDDFIDNNDPGAKKILLDAIIEAIRAKKNISYDENYMNDIKEILRKAQWKIVPHFGEYLPTNNSELSRVAQVFAKYAVDQKGEDRNILGRKGSPITHYEVAFEREVLTISNEVKYKLSKTQNMKSESYCDAKFRDEFIRNDKSTLRKEIFHEIKKFDASKESASDNELESILRQSELRVDQDFGKVPIFKKGLPDEWFNIKDEDIKDFLKHFMLIVNQPNVTDLNEGFYKKEIFLEGTLLGDAIDKLHPKFKTRIEKALRIHNKNSDEEIWFSGEQINQFVQEFQNSVYSYIMTLRYEENVMKYGQFTSFGQLKKNLGTFLFEDKKMKILCISTTTTMLTTVKILQYLNKKSYGRKHGQIFIETGDLNNDHVQDAFKSECIALLTIHIRQATNEQTLSKIAKEVYDRFFGIIFNNPTKKIILIIQKTLSEEFNRALQEVYIHFTKRNNFDKVYTQKNDDINLKDFEPKRNCNPLTKKSIVFQEQEEKISLAELTEIDSWDSFIDYLYGNMLQNEQDIIDIMVSILIEDEIEVGCKPPGISNLDGAYATLFEEVNTNTLANKLLSNESDNNIEEIFIISGIRGSRKEKLHKLIQYLGFYSEQIQIRNQLGEIGSESRIQIADDQFMDDDFKRICCKYAHKKIFWLSIKYGENGSVFILQQFYDPEFYFKRKFKQVVIKKELKKELIKECLSEIFIFYCVKDQQELLNFYNDIEKFKNNCINDKIFFFGVESDAKSKFKKIAKGNQIVHLLKFEEQKLLWCNTHYSLGTLQNYFEQSEYFLIEEDYLIKEISDRKVVIFSDEPGMGKTTTLTKLYESISDCNSFIKTHWVFRIKLKDHIEVLRNINLVNNIFDADSLIKFLTKIDAKLNHNIAVNLLRTALGNNQNFSKPLFFAFDGFDEILDIDDRNKLISLLTFLKEETTAKIWITTRLQYKEVLEDKLATFATIFDPMDEEDKIAYIYKYLKDRLYLILSADKFVEIFLDSSEMQENRIILTFIKFFLNNVESVFSNYPFTFIGTPLKLFLMLEGSISHFKTWIENNDTDLNFSHLGQDIWQVYENFIDRKYDVYFQKLGIREVLMQKYIKRNLDRDSGELAISIIFDKKETFSLWEFKDIILSAGILKSNNTLIHTTFIDYFAAKFFVHWIKNGSHEESNTNKQAILKQILKEDSYHHIRTFINHGLKNTEETEDFEQSLTHYEKFFEILFAGNENSVTEGKPTMLHAEIIRNNANIFQFLFNCLKKDRDVLKKYLFMNVSEGKTALHLACEVKSSEIVRTLLDAVAEMAEENENVLKNYLFMCNHNGKTPLHVACQEIFYNVDDTLLDDAARIVRLLLDTTAEISEDMNENKNALKKYLFMRDNSGKTPLHLACQCMNSKIVRILLAAVEKIPGDIEENKCLLKEYLFTRDNLEKSPLHCACRKGDYEIVNTLLDAVEGISESTLQEFLNFLDGGKWTALDYVVSFSYNVQILKDLLKRANNKQYLIENEEKRGSSLYYAFERGTEDCVRTLLQHFEDDKIFLKQLLLFERGHNNSLFYASTYSISLFQYVLFLAKSINDDKETLKKLLLPEWGTVTFDDAIEARNIDMLKILVNTAKEIDDDYHTLKQMLLPNVEPNLLYLPSFTPVYHEREIYPKIVELLLETADSISNEFFYIFLCTFVRKDCRNIIQVIEMYDLEKIFNDCVEILIEDKYHSIRKKVVKLYKSMAWKERLDFDRKAFISAIRWRNIDMVKHILDHAKETGIDSERLKTLLLVADSEKWNALHAACFNGAVHIVKELISYAMYLNDDGRTLQELITSRNTFNRTPFEVIEIGCTSVIKQTIENLVVQARNNNNEHTVNILKEIKKYEKTNEAFYFLVHRFSLKSCKKPITETKERKNLQ